MHRFIARQNIDHLANQFGSTADAGKRGALARLLVEEEDKLGRGYEQLEIAAHRIAIADILIGKQERLIQRYAKDGCDTTVANEVLVSLKTSKSLFEAFRRQVMQGIASNRL
jgi:hypothetical protein